ncbi:MAG: putative membrane protein YkoI [Gammaproteobacteria bacterium]|jgi:uncharacterized membrane protein YkoI
MLIMSYHRKILFGVLISFYGFVAAVHAQPDRVVLAQSAHVSQDQAAAKVREDTGGRVLDVKTSAQDGSTIYLVKVLLPDGHVRVVSVRAD